MQEITSIQQLEEVLKANTIVCTPSKKGLTYITMYKDNVRIQNAFSRYTLTFHDFLDLYSNQTFYIYEKDHDGEISLEKDAEYYSWYHK